MSKLETFGVTPARIGNSQGYRVDAGFFRAHPELRDGDFEAAYLGEGTFLVRQRTPTSRRASRGDSETDPVTSAYLAWTERAMTAQPNRLRPMSGREFELAEALVADVAVDIDADRLPDDFELP